MQQSLVHFLLNMLSISAKSDSMEARLALPPIGPSQLFCYRIILAHECKTIFPKSTHCVSGIDSAYLRLRQACA
jgi:hypothetical protein